VKRRREKSMMHDYIEERVVEEAKYLVSSKGTVRDTAKIFGVSKSTAHRDLTKVLPKINPAMSLQVKGILDNNFAEKHIRGGRVTKRKYAKITC
jgi:putative DeoR family transcriptional regulator (stage III sporulation protein D)